MTPRTTRRTVLLATGAAALAAGCGSDGGDGGGDGTTSGTAAPDGPAGQVLVATADVPVGGGTILEDEKIVVTQPGEGDFKAFSAICTHQNCVVADVADGTINCACHGSRFRIADGSVERGPATRPLPEERITVEGNSVRRA
ncbi:MULTISPECIES: Rieske (2Fe-2S) protein [unclassified Streptomyces]|uniref:Rieske (2Fe-2S) protein n=1 Tax=unclassified Streptomyces TaxID=2593676 RepID=UPI000F71FC03|nr:MULTISPECIES: Rieske (2Fe-2S) protein [unclassified Streptomyces]AZM63095.1 iron-sulfur protein [Streptomyces sp. WAC 01438]RSN00543.1 iron-sulfur protein [Streptomyces sp. WAC 01420]